MWKIRTPFEALWDYDLVKGEPFETTQIPSRGWIYDSSHATIIGSNANYQDGVIRHLRLYVRGDKVGYRLAQSPNYPSEDELLQRTNNGLYLAGYCVLEVIPTPMRLPGSSAGEWIAQYGEPTQMQSRKDGRKTGIK